MDKYLRPEMTFHVLSKSLLMATLILLSYYSVFKCLYYLYGVFGGLNLYYGDLSRYLFLKCKLLLPVDRDRLRMT